MRTRIPNGRRCAVVRRLGVALLLLALVPHRVTSEPAPLPVGLPARDSLPLTLETCLALRGSELFVLDLDGDGAPELVTCGAGPDTLSHSFVLASRLEGSVSRPLKQWNFVAGQGGLAGTADLLAGDGRQELLFWIRDEGGFRLRADALRLGPGGLRTETLWRSEAIPVPTAGAGAEFAPQMHGSGRLDAAADLWVALPVAGFGLAPRGPLLLDAQGRLRRHAAAAPNVYITALADLDGDGRPELFLGTHATCNGQRLPGEDDCHSYWRVIDADARRLLDVEAGGAFSEAQTQPMRIAGQAPAIAALLLGEGEHCPLRIYAADGRLLRERSLPAALWRSLVVDWDRDGSDELLLGLTDGRLLLLDRDLQLLADWRFAAAVGPLAAVDLRGRGRPDLLIAVGNRLGLFDQTLAPLALWDGELLYSHQLPQQATGWVSAEGRRFVAMSRGQPGASLLLELLPGAAAQARGEPARWLLALIAAVAGLAIGSLAGSLWLKRGGSAAGAATAAECWRPLRDQLRGFRHSAAARGQLDSLIFALRNSQGERDTAARYFPRLRAAAAAFRLQTLPILRQIGDLAAAGAWDKLRCRAFQADAERLAQLASVLAPDRLPPANELAAAERAARAISAGIEALHLQVDARLAVPPAAFIGLLLTRFAAVGLSLRLDLAGDWRDEAPVANPDEADQLFVLLGQLFRQRARGGAGVLLLQARREPTQLLVACRDDLAGSAPGAADLERLGIAAAAARLHCGLRCQDGGVQLAFILAEGPERSRQVAASDS